MDTKLIRSIKINLKNQKLRSIGLRGKRMKILQRKKRETIITVQCIQNKKKIKIRKEGAGRRNVYQIGMWVKEIKISNNSKVKLLWYRKKANRIKNRGIVREMILRIIIRLEIMNCNLILSK